MNANSHRIPHRTESCFKIREITPLPSYFTLNGWVGTRDRSSHKNTAVRAVLPHRDNPRVRTALRTMSFISLSSLSKEEEGGVNTGSAKIYQWNALTQMRINHPAAVTSSVIFFLWSIKHKDGEQVTNAYHYRIRCWKLDCILNTQHQTSTVFS